MATPKPRWTLKENARDSHTVIMPVQSGWEQEVLLMSDEHMDNLHCDRTMLIRHHEEALTKNAPIFKFGDTLCLMQGKWDKRSDRKQMRPELAVGTNYLDLVVEHAAKFYTPYASNIALIGLGNHETAILAHHETNMVERLVTKLNDRRPARSQGKVHLGAYTGFIQFRFMAGESNLRTLSLHYHHGYGGGGEVTRGMIDNNRTRGQYAADIFYSGHIHRRNSDENVVTSCSKAGVVTESTQYFLRGSCYKHERNCSWHISGGRAGRPLGGWWLKFSYRNNQVHVSHAPAT